MSAQGSIPARRLSRSSALQRDFYRLRSAHCTQDLARSPAFGAVCSRCRAAVEVGRTRTAATRTFAPKTPRRENGLVSPRGTTSPPHLPRERPNAFTPSHHLDNDATTRPRWHRQDVLPPSRRCPAPAVHRAPLELGRHGHRGCRRRSWTGERGCGRCTRTSEWAGGNEQASERERGG